MGRLFRSGRWKTGFFGLLSLLIHIGYLAVNQPGAAHAQSASVAVMSLSIVSKPSVAESVSAPQQIDRPAQKPLAGPAQVLKPAPATPARPVVTSPPAQSLPVIEQTEAITPQPASHALESAQPPAAESTQRQEAASPVQVQKPAEPSAPVITREPRYAEPPVRPIYPALARRRGWQGEVWLEVYVGPEGISGEPVVLSSSGYELLDQAALDVARQWRFLPERRNGQAVASRVQVPVQFALR